MSGERIAVIEDEPSIAASIAARLTSEGFDVETAGDGYEGVELCRSFRPDLVVLDLMLPGLDGLGVCREIQRDRRVPVLMLTARDSETDLEIGLAVGGDDYMVKPFSPRELVARVRALLRRASDRSTDTDSERLRIGTLVIDPATREVLYADASIHLTPTEFDLLRTLMANRGRLLTHGALLTEVWGPAYADDTATLRTHIANLRRKIEPAGEQRYIRTDAGVGYRLIG